MKDIKTSIGEERIEAVIERVAAAEERKLNETRWNNSDEQQKRAVQQLKELIEKHETMRISIENENATHKRQERGACLERSLNVDRAKNRQRVAGGRPSNPLEATQAEAVTYFVT